MQLNIITEHDSYSEVMVGSERVLIDNEDIIKLRNLTEYSGLTLKRRYVEAKGRMVQGIRHKSAYLHRLVLSSNTTDIDHVNHNPLDNRKNNLRGCTRRENSRNALSKGYHKYKEGWRVQIVTDERRITVGFYKTEKEAKIARKRAELTYFGEFAPQLV